MIAPGSYDFHGGPNQTPAVLPSDVKKLYVKKAGTTDTTYDPLALSDTDLNLTELAFTDPKDLPTTITAFRTGDVIPVDGPSGSAKMSYKDLLHVTAQNPIAGWWNFARTITTSNALAMDKNLVQGEQYLVYRGSHDITKVSFLEDGYINAQDVSFGDEDFVIFTADSAKKYILATSPNSQYGDVIVGNSSLIFSAIKKMQSDLNTLSSSTSASVSRINTILGSWNFAKTITSSNALAMDENLVQGEQYLAWRSSVNVTKLSFLEAGYINAQDVFFGDANFVIFTANSAKKYVLATSPSSQFCDIIVGKSSVIIDAIKTLLGLINSLPESIARINKILGSWNFAKDITSQTSYRLDTDLTNGKSYIVWRSSSNITKISFLNSSSQIV